MPDLKLPKSKQGCSYWKGTTCPECGSDKSLVLDKRNEEHHIMRRRACENGHRYTTRELVWQKIK